MFRRQKGESCLNCGASVSGQNFCSECGQANDTRRLTFLELIGESLSNFFAVDGRVFRTIAGVLTRPGKVALEFKAGKRMRFMNPVRFYFLSSVLLITSIQLSRKGDIVQNSSNTEELAQLKKEGPMEQSQRLFDICTEFKKDENPGLMKRFRAMTNYLIVSPESSSEEIFLQLGLEPGFWNEFAFSQAKKASRFGRNQTDNLKDFNRTLLSQLFWILFLFIPILGLILKLLYWRRDIYYPEHLFFTLYQQGLFFIASFLYNLIFDNELIFILLINAFGIHLYFAMKNFYGQGWGKTFAKFLLVNLFGMLSFTAFFILALILVFLMF